MQNKAVDKLRDISIHALRGEGDNLAASASYFLIHFNPRPPWGGRLDNVTFKIVARKISIHALRGEGDNTPFK